MITNVWGVHNDTLARELVRDSFISIGWDDLPALTPERPRRSQSCSRQADA